MDTLIDLPELETPEEAVIARYRLSDDSFGSPNERDAIFDAEKAMMAAVEQAGVGEVDGNEFGGGEAVVYVYGPDAEAHFKVMEPTLRGLPFRPAYVVLRQGSDETETRVDLWCGTATKYSNPSNRHRPTLVLMSLPAACMTSNDRSL
ncbi:hypothetical protein OHT59_44310 [Streptomyces sp. NBC_00243]|uniref:hypothetical protein n=1 Tax=Streptomyces sp. NBC_00243 TaxID=2975688 RepID=UPI002DD83EEC|nr:hypothetical protein [Streptomyces sp. NBC_00243]WRZ25057.1 hypothetical protein OHT59_44310 [Streptomyces sp. NBC_00243]